MSMGGKEDGGAGKMAKAEGKRADAAAKKLTEYGDQAVAFTSKFYDDYVKPQIGIMLGEQTKALQRADTVFGQQQAIFNDRENTYQTQGKPAVDEFFKMSREFDPEAEAQRRGITAMGDITNAAKNAEAQTMRGLGARGVNKTSGADLIAKSRGDLQANLVKAQEMQRLRNLTTQQKMGLTTAAAEFGAGLAGQAAALPGQSLQSGVIGTDVARSTGAGINAGAGIRMAGIEQASNNQANIFGPTKSAQAGLQQTSAQAKAQDGGIGGLLGTVAGGFLGTEAGAGALVGLFSDRKLKVNIERVGETPDGLPVYEYEYVWGSPRQRGYMAEEVFDKYPHAVFTKGGYLMVDYSKTRYKPWQI